MSVADHFVEGLAPVSNGSVPRDGDPRFEHLVAGLRSIEMKVRRRVFTTAEMPLLTISTQVWPHERFEEASELIESLARAFQNAHGPKLKSAFAETLTLLLHPINKVWLFLGYCTSLR